LPEFYSEDLARQSQRVLTVLTNEAPSSVVIGGWGSWAYGVSMASHDIDLIVDRPGLAHLSSILDDLSESHHLQAPKWRGTFDGIHVDLYVPYQSRLGRELQLQTERLIRTTTVRNDLQVLQIEAHLVTKFAALLDRPESNISPLESEVLGYGRQRRRKV